MLKYFKRQKSQRSNGNDKDVAVNNEKRNSLLSTSSFCDEILAEDDTQSCGGVSIDASNIGDEDIFNYSSRLSMSLKSILKDNDCMSYFVQYLETQNALPIIKFYLDTENFKISALEQLAKQEHHNTSSITNGCAQPTIEALHSSNEESDCLVEGEEEEVEETANSVPELKTLCDLSMHKPLTDDEKSQIYAETNKQITKHKLKACSEQSLYSELSVDDAHSSSSHAPYISAVSIKDAIAIYQKYLSPNAQLFVELPVNVLSDISLLLCKRQDETKMDEQLLTVTADCFDEAQQYVFNELDRLYLNDFLESPFYCKYCLELITDEKRAEQITINDILYSEATLFFFMEFLEQHGERECLDFWTTAINFRKSYACSNVVEPADSKEIQEDAMIIYKKFFSLQAEARLWLSNKLRARVEESICAPPAQVANCFDLALLVTAKYLEKKYFHVFLKSELFAQYVNELTIKIHEAHGNLDNFNDIGNDIVDGDFPALSLQHKLSFKTSRKLTNTPNPSRRHRKTLSDCTNDASRNSELFKHISQHNTLLAMDTSSMHFKNLQTSGTSMSIDARQLTNPNLLWQRRFSNTDAGNDNGCGLKFGYVNALGRYERDFETIESFNNLSSGSKHHWSLGLSGSKIKNAVRKLVNLPEHKAQEEIAWQIAEMIVKDVTSVTLKNGIGLNGAKDENTAS